MDPWQVEIDWNLFFFEMVTLTIQPSSLSTYEPGQRPEIPWKWMEASQKGPSKDWYQEVQLLCSSNQGSFHSFFLNCWQKWCPKNWQRVKDLRFYQKRHLWKWWNLLEHLRFLLDFFSVVGYNLWSIVVFVIHPGSYHEPTGDRSLDRLKEDGVTGCFERHGFFHHLNCLTGWWFQIFFIFIPIWGRFPFWLFFSKGVETTH